MLEALFHTPYGCAHFIHHTHVSRHLDLTTIRKPLKTICSRSFLCVVFDWAQEKYVCNVTHPRKWRIIGTGRYIASNIYVLNCSGYLNLCPPGGTEARQCTKHRGIHRSWFKPITERSLSSRMLPCWQPVTENKPNLGLDIQGGMGRCENLKLCQWSRSKVWSGAEDVPEEASLQGITTLRQLLICRPKFLDCTYGCRTK